MFFRTAPQLVAIADALPGREAAAFETDGIHRVLGTPIQPPFPAGTEVLYVGMGCFWGEEKHFWEIPGVVTTAVGYMGGFTPNPTYDEACTGRTGHTETVMVAYDPAQVSLDTLLETFWTQHDPTQVFRQGNDAGTQYRSAIYWTTPEQRDAIAATRERYQEQLTAAGYGPIATEIRPASEAGPFWYAEPYHQQYLAWNPTGYCPLHATGVTF